MLLGIDEVGRGPWAGPLVVGAVVLGDVTIDGLTDSKKLTKKRREELDGIIREHALAIGLGWVTALEIDQIGLSEALRQATIRAVAQITVPYHEIIIDGTVNFLRDTKKGQYVTTLKKADALIGSVSAASIVAKVARDAYMKEQDAIYPHYGFGRHMGYGTGFHTEAIRQYGVSPLHRLSFAPLAHYRAVSKKPLDDQSITLSPRQIGNLAEDCAAAYLVANGHQVIDRNWKTKLCEIDIVSIKEQVVYFTEVKYRRRITHGGGIDAVTPQKQRRMRFAADMYLVKHPALHMQPQLMAVAVTGQPPYVEHCLELQ